MRIVAVAAKPIFTKEYPFVLGDKAFAVMQVLLASCFISLCAQISVPLYFTPVPLTGQTLGVMLTGAFLGWRKGVAATLCYLLEGSLGLPVWAGGSAGIVHLFGPTGGYLLCYPLQVYFIGKFLEKKAAGKTIGVLAVAAVCQLGLGSLWLSLFTGVKSMFLMGFYLFVPGEIFKAILVTGFLGLRNKRQK